MTAENNLQQLLRSLAPVLNDGEYVFAHVANTDGIDRSLPVAEIREREGTTVVIARHAAEGLGLPYTYVAAWITLTVHSDLNAVGLTAAVANALAEDGISCNVIAGFYHDHLFVSAEDAPRAMAALRKLSETE